MLISNDDLSRPESMNQLGLLWSCLDSSRLTPTIFLEILILI